MSLATAKPQPLTVVSGGINRLRAKGGASRSALFDAINCYVTAANTVVPRPGTIRNADLTLNGSVPAGATKGLVGYQGQLHVFSASVVDVPTGYALHVLNHPAQNYVQSVATAMTLHAVTDAGNTNLIGFSANTAATTYGTLTPSTFTDNNGYMAKFLGLFNDTANSYLYVWMLTATNPYSISFTDAHGHVETFLFSAATETTGNSSPEGTYTQWKWTGLTETMFANGTNYTVTYNTTSNIAGTPIPIKEIHFAQPFFGGLYVVAEFDVPSSVDASTGSVFHYWIQSSTESGNSNEWTADTDVSIGQVMIPSTPNGLTYIASRKNPPAPLWTPNTAEVLGNVVEPNVANGKNYTATAVQGAAPTTGATEPTWPTTDGATVVEQSVLQNDQTITLSTVAPAKPTTPPPTKYSPVMV